MLSKFFNWVFGNNKSSVQSQITDAVTVDKKITEEPVKAKTQRKPRGPNKKKKV